MLALASGKSEFGHIALALHGMLSKIERDKEKLRETIRSLEQANDQILSNQASLIEAEKFAAVGRLSAGLAHEIGNPLGIIQGYIELLGRSDVTLEERKQYTSRAAKELTRMINLLQQLMNVARKPREESSRCSVNTVVEEAVEMIRYQKSTDTIQFQLDCGNIEEEVKCSEADLHQVLLNCLLNAVDAIHERQREGHLDGQGAVILATKKIQQEKKDFVKIVIKDNGRGVSEADLSSVFEPFFSTKEVGEGTGLGLAVSRTIIENSGGTIRLERRKGRGACVTIVLPLEKKTE
jgi:signal transduction histidine kinase